MFDDKLVEQTNARRNAGILSMNEHEDLKADLSQLYHQAEFTDKKHAQS